MPLIFSKFLIKGKWTIFWTCVFPVHHSLGVRHFPYTVMCATWHLSSQVGLSLVKPLSTHAPKHSVSEAFPGAPCSEMTSKESDSDCCNHCSCNCSCDSLPWGSEFKTKYHTVLLSSHSSPSFFSPVTGEGEVLILLYSHEQTYVMGCKLCTSLRPGSQL